ncbi:MAG: glycoside hydrolase family 3 N-terminal domain-containing protein [Rhodothermales bacterium]|nr:glycoside hydrolase family 3 N-terminal domain-containing protein [Rhodothermales bacterium]
MRETTLLDRLTAAFIVTCVVAVPAWMALQFNGKGTGSPPTSQDHYEEYLEGTGAWARSTLRQLTLEQKVSQLFSSYAYGVYTSADDPAYKRLVDLVERFQVGGILFFQGDPYSQLLLANELQARSNLPLLMSQDMESGAGMRISRTTNFPSAMALGATRNTSLAYAAGYATAREARALGIDQVYAPVADINNNAANPVINVRSFGERPDLVTDMVKAFTFGLQDGKVIATAKHFPGHGDTATDSHSDLPILPFDRARLDSVELVPFRGVRDAGIMSIMMGHLALPQLEPDPRVPATLASGIVTSLLREDLGFKGLIVSDAMRMTSITKHFGTGEAAVRAIEAGIDMLVLSQDEYAARSAILKAVEEGRLTEDRIDQSVLRVLQSKEWLGLHEERHTEPAQARQIVASQPHTTLAETIARASLTLIRNQGQLVPLTRRPASIASIALNDTDEADPGAVFQLQLSGMASGSRIFKRSLDRRATETDFAEALNIASAAELVIVPAFLPVRSGSNRIQLLPAFQRFLNTLIARRIPVVVIAFGSPYLIQALPAQPAVYVAAYSHSEASQKTSVQALFGQSGFSGTLPITIPGLYPFGHGLVTPQISPRSAAPEEVGMSGATITSVDSLIHRAIADQAFPGASVAIGRELALVKTAGYGYFTYDSDQLVTPASLFDVASMTKVIATTTAAMKLYEQGLLSLDAPVSQYIPEFGKNGKGSITIRHLFTHTSGLIPFRPFHEMGILTRAGIIDHVMGESLVYPVGSEMRYSDFNMIVLALVIERITRESFGDYVRRAVLQPLGMTRTGFRSAGQGQDPSIVPTEIDHTFRKRLVQGEVHDETAYILGGTAGHAGLFSSADDLTRFAFMLMNDGRVNGVPFLKPETIRLFTTAAASETHTRALGWDTRSPSGFSSAGTLFGPRSFGHTGFTGTSIWIDPDAKLFVVLLTNRVYPTRDNTKHNQVRSDLADIAFRAILGPALPILPNITHD